MLTARFKLHNENFTNSEIFLFDSFFNETFALRTSQTIKRISYINLGCKKAK